MIWTVTILYKAKKGWKFANLIGVVAVSGFIVFSYDTRD